MSTYRAIGAKTLDGLQYAIILTAVVTMVFGPLSVLLTEDLVFLKYALFFFGFLTLAIGSWKLRPPARGDASSRLDLENTRADRGFGAFVNTVPPGAWILAPEDRLSDGARIALAGVVLLVFSWILEVVFHVGVPTALQ
jgi:hypothetical protein